MIFWMTNTVAVAAAYLLGSIPTGYLAGRLLAGIDLREHGSGSTGATNVLRSVGKWPAAGVLAVDVLKGVAAIVLARWLFARLDAPDSSQAWTVCLAGVAVLLGHSRSVWLNFKGGKSAATGLGVLLAMSWPVGAGAAAAFGLVLAIFRIVSLSSLAAASTAIALVCILTEPWPYRLLVVAGGLYVIALHRANIRRLMAGTEPRIGRKLS
ncbi:MAG: glycerol-3-phosphate acyltransferase [Reyranella sp.]|nr:glycerol-3-phosphate acyltransferase [Reyranella sp.]